MTSWGTKHQACGPRRPHTWPAPSPTPALLWVCRGDSAAQLCSARRTRRGQRSAAHGSGTVPALSPLQDTPRHGDRGVGVPADRAAAGSGLDEGAWRVARGTWRGPWRSLRRDQKLRLSGARCSRPDPEGPRAVCPSLMSASSRAQMAPAQGSQDTVSPSAYGPGSAVAAVGRQRGR